MENIKIKPGCIACGACEFLAPDVFEVTDVSRVKVGADIKNNEKSIMAAKAACPVGVIAIGETTGDKKEL